MKLCLGTVQFGMDYGVQGAHRQSYRQIDEMIEYAVMHGIEVFDSAAAYGEAEDVLGHYIRHKMPGYGKIRAVSKLAAGVFDGMQKEDWGDIALKNAKKSLESLGVSSLDAYFFHQADYIDDADAVRALYEVRKAGLADKIGVSAYTPRQAVKALEYEETGAVQVPYNLFDHRLDRCGFFKAAKKKNVTVYARSTLLQGLVMMDASLLPENMKFAEKYLASLKDICRKFGVSPLEAAAGYVKQHGGIDYIVFGADSMEQLKEYLLIQDKTIPGEMAEELDRAFYYTEEKLVSPVLWK